MSWIKSIKLVKFNEVVSKNEFFPVVNVVNWGRSMNSIKSIKLVKLNEVVEKNDWYPVVNEVNWGRSNELNQINQTGQTQWSCFFEWPLSCSECCELRKIKWVESNHSNLSNSMKLFHRMNHLLQWMMSIEEDPMSSIESSKLDNSNEVVL